MGGLMIAGRAEASYDRLVLIFKSTTSKFVWEGRYLADM